MSNTLSIPFLFRSPDHNLYPVDNYKDSECWLAENIKDEEIKSDRIYLRIFWTSFYKNNCNYGNDKNGIKILQNYLDTLDTSKRYFTIISWDDGILNDISHLDIKVFSMAGGRKDYGLPLICQPHKILFDNKKDIFCSFVGRITNPIRQEIVNAYTGKEGYYVSTKNHSLPEYCRVLSRSVFTLAIRGYSATSFRIMEAIEYNSIPVYVSDLFYEPHGVEFNSYGIKIHSSDYKNIDEILRSISKEEIEAKQKGLSEIFGRLYSFEGNKKLILENI